MPLQATSGAASQDAFGGNGVAVVPTYIEDIFSCFLYTGNGTSQTITNGVDLSTKGGLVWIKERNAAGNYHVLTDTVRGTDSQLRSNASNAADTEANRLTAFTTSGFSLGNSSFVNGNTNPLVSWTFREQAKFFDVVTYTGNGSAPRNISHNLGSSAGFIVIKRTDSTGDWWAWHRSIANKNIYLNYTDAADSGANPMISAVSSTNFTLATNQNATMNINGATYVAYLFAHDAGGFGLTGADNVISCGSFTTNGSGVATVNLGYEPQFVLFKRTDSAGQSWEIIDTMRGFSVNSNGTSGNVQRLSANSSGAETNSSAFEMYLTSTGFATNQYFYNATYIYIAIRRGPMKVPTDATKVFSPIAYTGNSTTNTTIQNLTTNFAGDVVITQIRDGAGNAPLVFDKLRGNTQAIYTANTASEENIATARPGQFVGFNNTQTVLSGRFTSSGNYNLLNYLFIAWNFRRAPSFFDAVCYTGTGSNRTVAHNLTVAPELMLFKVRASITDSWQVYCSALDVSGGDYLILNDTAAKQTNGSTRFTGAPTSTLINLATNGSVNGSGNTYVAYLFDTLAGVSKVGSYTGTGALQTVNCGFTGGARFVLIKRTDTTGDWWTYDSARGISSGNDPYLFLNSTAAEVTNTNYVDTDSTGFKVTAAAPAGLNANGGNYIFLAIA